jgi:hypothetical protein
MNATESRIFVANLTFINILGGVESGLWKRILLKDMRDCTLIVEI